MRLFKWLAGFLVLAVALFTAVGVGAGMLLSGSSKDRLLDKLTQSVGVKIDVASADFDLSAWFHLRPAIALHQVAVGNPKGFRGAHLLEAESIEAQVGLISLFRGRPEIHAVRIQRPKILIEKNAAGDTNVETFLQVASAGAGGTNDATRGTPANGGTEVVVETFAIEDGEVRFPAGGTSLTAIHIQLTDFAPGKPCHIETSALLFGGKDSKISFEGQAGPFSPTSVAIDGKAALALALAEIPAKIRKEELGAMLAEPGKDARVDLDITMKGDLYETLSGPAQLTVKGVQVGEDPARKLPLEGKAPATFSVRKIMSQPAVDLKVNRAALKLGSGQWKGNLAVSSGAGRLQGSSDGEISGIDVNEFLSSFTSSRDKMQGQLRIPSYKLRFAGKDAAEIQRSLSGEGRVELDKGKVKALDLLASIQRAIEKQPEQNGGTTEFSTLKTDIGIGGESLMLSNLVLDSPVTRASGSGRIGFNQALDMHLGVDVSGRIAELLGKRGENGQPARTSVPVDIAGTSDAPRVRPNIGKVAVSTGMNYLQNFLNKKLKK